MSIEENYNILIGTVQQFGPFTLEIVEHHMHGPKELRWRVAVVGPGVYASCDHKDFSTALTGLVSKLSEKPKKCEHCGGEVSGKRCHHERGAH